MIMKQDTAHKVNFQKSSPFKLKLLKCELGNQSQRLKINQIGKSQELRNSKPKQFEQISVSPRSPIKLKIKIPKISFIQQYCRNRYNEQEDHNPYQFQKDLVYRSPRTIQRKSEKLLYHFKPTGEIVSTSDLKQLNFYQYPSSIYKESPDSVKFSNYASMYNESPVLLKFTTGASTHKRSPMLLKLPKI